MVFLHPVILKDKKTMRDVTSEKYNFLRAQQMDMRQKGLRLLDDKETPIMPELQQYLTLPPPYEDSAQRMELNKPGADLNAPPPISSVPAHSSMLPQEKTTDSLTNPSSFPVPAHSSMLPQEKTTDSLTSPPANNGNQTFEPPFIGDGDAGTPPQ